MEKNIILKLLKVIKLIEYLDEHAYIYFTGDYDFATLGTFIYG